MSRALWVLGRKAPDSLRYRPQPAWIPPMLATLVEELPAQGKLDGEIVAFDPERGVTSFAQLQQRMQLRDPVRARRSPVPVYLYLFDCLFYEGVDLTALPLLDRKAVLRDVVWYDDPIRFTPYRTSGFAAMFQEACKQGAEGRQATGIRHRRIHSPAGIARALWSAPGRPL